MKGAFYEATSFNIDLSTWDTGKVINLVTTFYGATNFNGNVSTWNTESVTNMNQVFSGASSFNGDLSNWDTSLNMNLWNSFTNAHSFVGIGLETWNVSNCNQAWDLFTNATSLNVDLSSWNVQQFIAESMFTNTLSLSECNRRRIYDSWMPQMEPESQYALSFHEDYASWASNLCFDCSNTGLPDGPGGNFTTYPDDNTEPIKRNSGCYGSEILRSSRSGQWWDYEDNTVGCFTQPNCQQECIIWCESVCIDDGLRFDF